MCKSEIEKEQASKSDRKLSILYTDADSDLRDVRIWTKDKINEAKEEAQKQKEIWNSKSQGINRHTRALKVKT